jgi:hypothetical protein
MHDAHARTPCAQSGARLLVEDLIGLVDLPRRRLAAQLVQRLAEDRVVERRTPLRARGGRRAARGGGRDVAVWRGAAPPGGAARPAGAASALQTPRCRDRAGRAPTRRPHREQLLEGAGHAASRRPEGPAWVSSARRIWGATTGGRRRLLAKRLQLRPALRCRQLGPRSARGRGWGAGGGATQRTALSSRLGEGLGGFGGMGGILEPKGAVRRGRLAGRPPARRARWRPAPAARPARPTQPPAAASPPPHGGPRAALRLSAAGALLVGWAAPRRRSRGRGSRGGIRRASKQGGPCLLGERTLYRPPQRPRPVHGPARPGGARPAGQ